MESTSPRIACVGAGLIGRSWAIAFARAGLRVNIFDSDARCQSTCLDNIASSLAQAGTSNLPDLSEATLQNITVVGTLEHAVSDADYVQESVSEQLDAKRSLFAELDRLTVPTAILASSSSELSASLFTGSLPGRQRCLVAHPLNPPHAIPVVEIVASAWTSPESIATAVRIMKDIGQEPILIHKDLPGFAINRLQLALIGEALHLVGEGVISADDLDKAVTRGLGLRWALMGPFEAGHLNSPNGYLDYVTKFESAMRSITGDLRVDYPWNHALVSEINDQLSKRIPSSRIQECQNRRDRRIADLRHYLEQHDKVVREQK